MNAPVQKHCAHCGTEASPRLKRCELCGRPLVDGPAPTPTAPASAPVTPTGGAPTATRPFPPPEGAAPDRWTLGEHDFAFELDTDPPKGAPPKLWRTLADLTIADRRDTRFLRALLEFAAIHFDDRPPGTQLVGFADIRVVSQHGGWEFSVAPGHSGPPGESFRDLGVYQLESLTGCDAYSGLPLELGVLPQEGSAAPLRLPALGKPPAPCAGTRGDWTRWRFLLEILCGLTPLDPRGSALREWLDGRLLPPFSTRGTEFASWSLATLGEWAAADWAAVASTLTTQFADWLPMPLRGWCSAVLSEETLSPSQRLEVLLVGTGVRGGAELIARLQKEQGLLRFVSSPAGRLLAVAPGEDRVAALIRRAAERLEWAQAASVVVDPSTDHLLRASDSALTVAARARGATASDPRSAFLFLLQEIAGATPETALTDPQRSALAMLPRLRETGLPIDGTALARVLALSEKNRRWEAEFLRLRIVSARDPHLGALLARTLDDEQVIQLLSLHSSAYITRDQHARAQREGLERELAAARDRALGAREEARKNAAEARRRYDELLKGLVT